MLNGCTRAPRLKLTAAPVHERPDSPAVARRATLARPPRSAFPDPRRSAPTPEESFYYREPFPRRDGQGMAATSRFILANEQDLRPASRIGKSIRPWPHGTARLAHSLVPRPRCDGYDQFYSGTVLVKAGDTIDFTVGFGMVASGNDFVLYPYANYYSDSTGLDAVITSESQTLTSDLTNLVNGSNLTATQKNQLNSLLSAIVSSMTSGNKSGAILELKALVAVVTSLMWSTPARVPAALGNHLVTDANEAIAALSL